MRVRVPLLIACLSAALASAPAAAGLGETLPKLFLDVVNKAIKGSIEPEKIRYKAPTSLVLENARLLAPGGEEVARVRRAEINVAVSELFVGNITIEKLDVEGGVLKLARRNDELNLVKALEPVKPRGGGKSSLKVKLDGISLTAGAFRYDDVEAGVNIEANNISGRASVSVDLKTDVVKVDATNVRVRDGKVRLEKLDIPLRDVRLARFKQRNLRLDLSGGTGRALGDASFSVDGQIRVKDAGLLSLGGIVRTPRGAWPERLKALAFETPELDGTYRVSGPLRDPTVEVDGNLGRLDAYGLRATRGNARVIVDKRKVRIRSAGLALGVGGTNNVTATGTYTIDNERLALDLEARGAPLSELVRSAELEDPPRGSVSGRARVTGVADGDAPLTIEPDLVLRGGRGFSLTLPETRVTGRIFATSARVDLAETRAQGAGLDVQTKGFIDLDKKRIDLDLTLEGRDLHRRIPDLPEDIVIGAASARGSVKGPYKNPQVSARVTVASADAYGVPIADARARVAATKTRTVLEDLTATVSGGALSGRLEIDTRAAARLAGTLALVDGDLARLKVTDDPLPVTGKVTRLTARVTGPAKSPVIEADVATSGLEVEGEKLGVARARGIITRDEMTLGSLTLEGGIVHVRALTPIWLSFDNKGLAGRATVHLPDLARVKAANGHARGRVEGELLLGGTIDAPDVRAVLWGRDLVARGVALGDADAVIRALPDAVEGRAVQLTGRFDGPAGSLDIRAAYALERERVHANIQVIEADLAPWLKQVPEAVAPLQGIISGHIVLRGDPRAPDAEVKLRVPELALPVAIEGPLTTADQMRELRAFGPLTLEGTLKDKLLDAKLCASPSSLTRPAGPGGEGVPVWVSASGPLDLKEKYLDLEVALGVSHKSVEELVIPLRELGMKLDAALSGLGRVRWRFEDEETPRVTGRYTLEGAVLEMEGAPRVELLRPAKIAVARNQVTLLDELRFSAGEGILRVAGKASQDEIDLTLRGDVGTPLLKLYTDEVTVARGEVRADLTVTGAPSALRLSGSLTPKPDAAIGLRSIRQTVVLDGGRVLFTLEGGAQKVHIDRANPLRASIGDGTAALFGDVAFSFPDDSERPIRFDRWDVHATADDLFIRSGTTFVETSAKLKLVGPREAPVLSGTVDISDGNIRESFDLRNFVLESVDDEPSRPLNERLAVVDLEQLRLDLGATVRSFRARAEIGTFPLDLTMAGDLRATGTLEVPQLTGALEVVSGDLVLPRARFDVVTARFEWSPERPGLVPRIFLSALADLPAQGTCDVDIPVELTLQGDDLDRIDLDLSAADSGAAHTRSDLLKAVLAGVALPACSDDPSGDLGAAWRALLSPVSTQVSREIEALLAGSVGGDFTINPFFDGQRIATDVRWDLGRRVQLEGETGIRAGRDIVTDDDIPIAGADVRMRLLLWDPFLFGKELFLEGELTSEQDSVELTTRIETRLKWRIFER